MLTPEQMATLHARCFHGAPRPWTAQEFADYGADQTAHIVTAVQGFAIARVIAGEAELLTLAVDPEARRKGVAHGLLVDLSGAVAQAGADVMYLEVSADNAAARALYGKLGFVEVGQRSAYYSGTDALILRRAL
jgi:ribosomal-protein-alanine N-acetyltransferase